MSSISIVDLVGSPSISPSFNAHNDSSSSRLNTDRKMTASLRKKRRTPRFRNGSDETIKNVGIGTPDITLIDLASDTPPPPASAGMKMRSGRRKAAGKKRPRQQSLVEINIDDDVVEIVSPAKAKAAAPSSFGAVAAASRKQRRTSPDCVDRIREVFPLLSRAKVENFLTMARSYSTEDGNDNSDGIFYTVMAVLSEDPLGASVSGATFAAAAMGNRSKGGNATMAAANKASRPGKRKVAQLECQCCFGETDFEEMVSCRSGGHLFCKTCLQRHVEQRVFGNGNLGVKPNTTNNVANAKNASRALEILCMADCSSGFDERQLRDALSEKVLKKYNELQYAAVIESANMGDVAKCTKCDFIAVTNPLAPPLLFHCPKCNFKSCRDCGEEYHPGIRCDQVETKGEMSGRNVVEEAMTSAMVRTCPRPMCRKKFLKTEGCNKMTCSCGCFICYVCRKEIPANVAYQHFCQTPHCNHKSCNKCPLYADTSKEDKARVKNAAKKAAKSVRKQVNVDVDSMLKDPPAQLSRKR